MIRTIIWYSYFWLFMVFSLFLTIPVIILSLPWCRRIRKSYILLVVRVWARSLIALAGGEVTVRGLENIPASGRICFISNHQGNFDIPLVLGYLPGPVGFIAKKELKRLPIVNLWMSAIGCIFLNRSDRRGAVDVMRNGVRQLKSGHTMLIFPEGTRSRGEKMGVFKHGSLKMPIRAGATIIPVTISGSYKLKEKTGYFAPGKVILTVHPPLDGSAFTESETRQVSELLTEIIGKNLQP